MQSTINKIMTAVLEQYPKVNLVSIDVFDAQENEYGWTTDYSRITLTIKGRTKVLSPDEIYNLFNEQLLHFRFPKNNASRKIVKDRHLTVSIEANQKSFTNNKGEVINYYPSRTFPINNRRLIQELTELTQERYKRFIELSFRTIDNEPMDIETDIEE